MANNLWNNYTKKDTPVDNDELMIYDSEGKNNKKLLFGGFWKWIAKKLKEAELADLQTADKTVVGAINTLNSDSPDAIAKIFSSGDGSAKILLKNTESTYLRYTALLFLCSQNGGMVGIYLIGVGSSNEKITKIVGNEVTLKREGDHVTVSFVGYSSIWSDGIIIAPKRYL